MEVRDKCRPTPESWTLIRQVCRMDYYIIVIVALSPRLTQQTNSENSDLPPLWSPSLLWQLLTKFQTVSRRWSKIQYSTISFIILSSSWSLVLYIPPWYCIISYGCSVPADDARPMVPRPVLYQESKDQKNSWLERVWCRISWNGWN